MSDRKLERLFVRFRKQGDAAAMAEVFDRAGPELLELAVHLVRDPTEAEDVVQSTFLAAIEGAWSYDPRLRLMPWLVGILTRQAGLARRRARREVEPDRLHQREVPDPARQAQAQELSCELAGALESLPIKYREILSPYLTHGMRPVEIARRLRRAPGTVRMQMHRGLEMLRRALPAGFAATGVVCITPTGSWAAVREKVVARAHTFVRSGGALSTGAATGASVATILKLALAGVLVAAVAGAARMNALQPASGSLAVDVPAATVALESRDPVQLSAAASTHRELPAPVATLAEPTPEHVLRGHVLRGHVLGLREDELEGAELRVRAIARFAWPEELVARGKPERDGSFELDVSPLFEDVRPARPREELLLQVDHPRYAPAEVRLRLAPALEGEYRADVRLEAAARIEGRVVDELGRPREDARVAAFRMQADVPHGPALDLQDCGQSFALRLAQPGRYAVVALVPGQRPGTALVNASVGTTAAIGALGPPSGQRIEGRAPYGAGSLRHGARVEAVIDTQGVRSSMGGEELVWNAGAFERGRVATDTGADGSFFLSGLAPLFHHLHASPRGAGVAEGRAPRTRVRAPAHGIELPVFGAHVDLAFVPELEPGIDASSIVRQAGRTTRSELDPSRGIDVEPGVASEITVEVEGYLPATVEVPALEPGDELRELVGLFADTGLGAVTFRWVDARGGTVTPEKATFVFEPEGPEATANRTLVRHVRPLEGSFRVDDIPFGSWTVTAHAGGAYRHYLDFLSEARVRLDVRPGSETRSLVCWQGGARLRLSATDADGRLLRARCRVFDAQGQALDVRFLGARPEGRTNRAHVLDGLVASDVYPNLVPGEYKLELRAEGFEPRSVFVRLAAGEYTELPIPLEPVAAP
jgi:RNA polymerase sigma-70 factor (ECF subfamily)